MRGGMKARGFKDSEDEVSVYLVKALYHISGTTTEGGTAEGPVLDLDRQVHPNIFRSVSSNTCVDLV